MLKILHYESCQLGKHVQSTFQSHEGTRVNFALSVMHSNIWGPSRVSTSSCYKYFVSRINNFSWCSSIYLMKECYEIFIGLIACHFINKMPFSSPNNQLLYSILFPTELLFQMTTRVFGCTYFIQDLTPTLDKLSTRAIKCIFLGTQFCI